MIRKVIKEDLENVYQLICELEQDQINKERFEKVYLEALNNDDVYYYVYVHEDQIVGFISFYVQHYLHHHHDTGEIIELVVSPAYRGLKIGDQLLRFIEELASELKLEEVGLCTSTYRKDAHRFYEAHGYVKDHYNYIKKL